MKKISVVITILNEEKSIGELLQSLVSQSQKPSEIIVVDGGSSDRTIEVIKKIQKKSQLIKLIIKKSSRSQGRNIGVKAAKYQTIAITDADCTASKHWLKNITKPFQEKKVELVAGFYQMVVLTPFQRALSVYLGVSPGRFTDKFLPSTRSIAFTKRLWKKIGGFPGGKENIAEDTVFNHRAVLVNAKIERAKNAIVYWKIPNSLTEAFQKLFIYAQWDAQSKIVWHPTQKFASHNLKIALVYLRYILGAVILALSFTNPWFFTLLILGLAFYILWILRKVFSDHVSPEKNSKQYGSDALNNWKVGLWGIFLQFTADIAVMSGFFTGTIKNMQARQ